MGALPPGQIRSDDLPDGRVIAIDCRYRDEVVEIASLSFETAWKPQDFAYFLAHECGRCWGAVDESGRLLAYFIGLFAQGDLDVVSVATRPEGRRRGLAAKLLETAMRSSGVQRTFLEVAVDNTAAVALYRKVGFYTLNVRRGYYEGKRDAYVMTISGSNSAGADRSRDLVGSSADAE